MKRSEYEERNDAENLELVVDAAEKGDSVGPPVPAEESSPQSASAAGDPATSEVASDVVQEHDATLEEGTSDAPGELVV